MSSPHSPQNSLLLLPLQTSCNRNTFQVKKVVLWVISVPLLLTTTIAKTRSTTTSITLPVDTTITLSSLLSSQNITTSTTTTSLSKRKSINNSLQFWFHPCKTVSASFCVIIAANSYIVIGIGGCLINRFLPPILIAVYYFKVLLQKPNNPTTLHSVSFKRLNAILPTTISFNWWSLLVFNLSAPGGCAASALKHTNPARTTPSSSHPQLILCNLKSLVYNSCSITTKYQKKITEMSKLSFRARALDPSKQMPIFLAEELPDLPEYSAINRAVPQMPSGMEKEEESEHHLQRAICTGLIIPTPEVYSTEAEFYDKSYPPNFRMPRQLIHMQPLGLEQDVPEYDMDSDDELWIDLQRKRLDLTPLKFEQMMDRLEKSSGQTVVTLNEAKALLKQDDEVSIAVYDYWLNKRLKMKNPLILTVKTENRPGTSSNNPYLAFRRRTEKMQTRKNRKNDETSYEKMLKLRRDLQRATTVLEMVKRREKTKREQLHLSIEIFEKRVQLKDFSGALLSELSATLKNTRPAFAPLYANQYSHHHHSSSSGGTPTAVVPGASSSAAGLCNVMGSSGGLLTSVSNVSAGGGGASHLYSSASQYLNSANIAMDALNTGSRKEKRQYKKRKHKIPRDKQQLQQQQQYLAGIGVMPASASSTAGGLVGSTSMTGSAVHHGHHHHLPHHLHPLHRQSSSPAPNESNIETEEEDLAHKVGSESEEEAPFAFRRKQGCDYLRTRTRTGNWPWEPKEEDGYGDNKYRFTLTSIRHPRARCIGFARRRLGRGGRVLLDRVATNFDDFWSQLDYTILETPHTLNENANKAALKKPASPPTVVDLPRSAFATGVGSLLNSSSVTPAIEIKKEVNEVGVIDNTDNRKQTQGSTDYAYFSENKIERKNEERNEMETDQRDGFQISRDTQYQSYLSVSQAEPGQRKLPSAAFEPDGKEQQQTVMKLMQRRLLLKLSKSLNVDINSTNDKDSIKTSVVCPNNTISCQLQSHNEIKQENVNSDKGENVEQHTSPNTISHRINNTLVTLVGEVHVNSINHNHIGSSSINTSNNFNNRTLGTLSCSGRISNLSDKYNVIKTEASPSLEATMASSVQLLDPSERKFIKQEQIDMTVSLASADDSNEPLSSIQKMTCGSISSHTDIMEDEENVNLAQLSNLIKHTVKKEISEEGQYPSSPNVESIYQSKQTLRENDLLATFKELDEDDGVCSLNQMPDVVRVENMKRPRVRKVRTNSAVGLNGVNLLIEEVAAVNNISDQEEEMAMMGSLSPSSSQRLDVCNELLSEIRRDWVHFRPKTPTETEKQDACSLDLEAKVQARVPLVSWSQQSPIAVEMLRDPLECRKHTEDEKSIWKAGVDKDSLFITSSFKYDDLEPDAQLLPHSYIADFARSDSKSPEVQSHQTNACLDFNLSGDSLNDINLLGDGDDADMLDNILQEVQIDDIKTLNQATNFWNGILDGEAVDAEVVGDVETAAGLLDGIDEAKKSGDKSSSGGKRCQHNKGKAGKRSCALLMPVGCSSFTTTALNNETLRDDCFFHKEQTKTKAPAVDDVIPEEIVEIKPEPKEVKVEAVVTNSNNFPTLPPLPPPPTLVPQPMLRPALAMTTTTATTMPSSAPVLNINQNKGNEPTIEHHTGIVVQQQQLRLPQQQQQQQQQHHHHQYLGSQPAMAAPLTIASTAVTLATTNPSVQQAHQQQFTTSAATIQVLQQQQPAAQQIRNVTIQQLHQLQLQQQRKIQLQQQQHQKLLMQRDTSVLAQYVPSSAHNATTTSSPTPTMLRQPSLTPIGTTSVANSGTAGQMIYTTTSSGEVIAAAGSPKIYLQKASASGAASHSQVNIINTSSGQLTVQNIANVQQLTASGSGTNTSGGGSLIVATATRNAVQQLAQQQQQQLVNQPIVWRQIGSTNVTTAPAGIMAATASTSTDGSDISKLLLNRKLSQRKIVAQQQQQLQDDDLTKNNAGQMQVQIGPQGMAHALLRGRIANNQAIFTNMRTLPIAVSTGGSAVVNSTPSGSANNIQVLSGSGSSNNLSNNCTSGTGVVNNSSHTLSTENSANNQDMLMNNNSATVGSPASVLSTVSGVGGKDVKSVVVELTASGNANNGPCMANNNNAANGNNILTSSSSSSISITNNNSNGNSSNSNNSNATASMLTTNNTTINR
uniref:Enhancer of polycomb-like protein n=1 Tax=Glossina austeni TaxID=7395 RepID=A0A1A9UQ24_GLOAU